MEIEKFKINKTTIKYFDNYIEDTDTTLSNLESVLQKFLENNFIEN